MLGTNSPVLVFINPQGVSFPWCKQSGEDKVFGGLPSPQGANEGHGESREGAVGP